MQKINIKKKFQQDRRKLTEMEQMYTESEDEPLKFDPILRVKFKKKELYTTSGTVQRLIKKGCPLRHPNISLANIIVVV